MLMKIFHGFVGFEIGFFGFMILAQGSSIYLTDQWLSLWITFPASALAGIVFALYLAHLLGQE